MFLSLRDSGVGWSMHLWRAEGGEAQRLCKRDQPINAYVWIDIYSVGDRKQDSVRERNVDGETTDRYRDGDAS